MQFPRSNGTPLRFINILHVRIFWGRFVLRPAGVDESSSYEAVGSAGFACNWHRGRSVQTVGWIPNCVRVETLREPDDHKRIVAGHRAVYENEFANVDVCCKVLSQQILGPWPSPFQLNPSAQFPLFPAFGFAKLIVMPLLSTILISKSWSKWTIHEKLDQQVREVRAHEDNWRRNSRPVQIGRWIFSRLPTPSTRVCLTRVPPSQIVPQGVPEVRETSWDHQQEISHHLRSFRMIMRAEFAQSDNDIETRLVRTKVARELLPTVGGNGASTKRTAAGRHGTGELHVSSGVWTRLHYGTWRESQAWITVLWNSLTQMNLQICADMLGVDISPNIWRQLPIGGAPHSHCNGGILRVRHHGLLLSNGTPCLQQDRLWLECTTQGRGRRKA